MKHITVITTVGRLAFRGRYRRDLETNNWHYYENETGDLLHFSKEHMVAVLECALHQPAYQPVAGVDVVFPL